MFGGPLYAKMPSQSRTKMLARPQPSTAAEHLEHLTKLCNITAQERFLSPASLSRTLGSYIGLVGTVITCLNDMSSLTALLLLTEVKLLVSLSLQNLRNTC